MRRSTPPLQPAMRLVFLAAAFIIIGVVSWQPQPPSKLAISRPYSPHWKTFPWRMKQRMQPTNLVLSSSDSSFSSSSSSCDVDEDPAYYVSLGARRCKITTTTSSTSHAVPSIRKFVLNEMRQVATKSLLLLIITATTLPPIPVNAMTAADLQSGDISTEELMKALQPATKERPPIAFSAPSSSSSKTAASKMVPTTVIPALIGLANPQVRPNPSDTTLIIRVYKDKTAQELLGGAKIPVNKIRRFPLQVQLTPSNNALNPQREHEWKELANQQEFFVQVTVEESSSTIIGTATDDGVVVSTSGDDKDSSTSKSKIVILEASSESIVLSKLPGLDADDWTTLGQSGIRPPLTLTLRPPVSQ